TYVVVGKDSLIYRFSAHKAFWLMGPLNPVRRGAMRILTHPLFSMAVMVTILANCIFMALSNPPKESEYVFTAIYTCEALVKMLSRGFILRPFTYLRDAWNWLDFCVVSLAYLTEFVDLGNVSALRTFRVLRALKTVAVVPGLKTIVQAVIISVQRLRDVMILTCFFLYIFALVGLQVYMGCLTRKCVKHPDWSFGLNYTVEIAELNKSYLSNDSNWLPGTANGKYYLCGNSTGSNLCPENYTCVSNIGENPNYGFTSFDNFGWAILSSFRLMTQDFWENLYQLVIRSMGPWHMLFFIMVLFLGSYYLLNLILAIVAMAYDEQQKQTQADIEEAEAERKEEAARKQDLADAKLEAEEELEKAKDPDTGEACEADDDRLSVTQPPSTKSSPGMGLKQRKHLTPNKVNSLPASPNLRPKNLQENMRLSTLSFPFADDSNAVTPEVQEMYPPRSNSVKKRQSWKKKFKLPSSNISNSNTFDAMLAQPDAMEMESLTAASMRSLPQEPDEEEDELTRGEYIVKKLNDTFCAWTCCPCWYKLSEICHIFIFDCWVDLFVLLCIIANTAFMAADHHGMTEQFAYTLQIGNYFFTTVFTAEAVIKLVALGPKLYFKDTWNKFDFTIVTLSLVELGLANVKGLSILRSFRLMRVLKLAKSWPTLNLLLGIIGRTLGALGNLTFVVGILIFIFAVMGMQLFGQYYELNYHRLGLDQKPRWHMHDFFHSFMIVFRVLCGEWIESMWDCMIVAGAMCVPFFMLTVILGNLVVLNLFLALLLSSFGADSLQKQDDDDDEPNKIAEAIDRFKWVGSKIKYGIMYSICVLILKREPNNVKALRSETIEMNGLERGDPDGASDNECIENGTNGHKSPTKSLKSSEIETDGNEDTKTLLPQSRDKSSSQKSLNDVNGIIMQNKHAIAIDDENNEAMQNDIDRVSEKSTKIEIEDGSDSKHDGDNTSNDLSVNEDTKLKTDDEADGTNKEETEIEEDKDPFDCWCPGCYDKFIFCQTCTSTPIGQKYWKARVFSYWLVENNYFETFIIVMILLSSLALAIEDIHLVNRPWLQTTLYIMDKIFTIIFILEMLLKWVAYGYKKYFTDAWCWLDFVIVAISIVGLVAEMIGAGKIGAFKALRTLRALRPLRAVSRWEGMKIIVNALFRAIPAICNVGFVILVMWLIGAIMGCQLFGGQFYKCVDAEGNKLTTDIVANRTECDNATNKELNYTWVNSKVNFDHVFNAYLSLFQVATFKGWIEVMNDAIDSRGDPALELQPKREERVFMYLYFVIFIIFGSFFTLNLFIGVVIDNFNAQKSKEGGMEIFMTEEQRRYYQAMKKMGSQKPQKPVPRPKWRPQAAIFDFVMDQKFDIAIMAIIMLNMVLMACEYYDQPDSYSNILYWINAVFIVVFTMECVLKLFGLRQHYFKSPWNVFDFIIVIVSILALFLADIIAKYFVSPTLLRVVRIARVGRVLRLVKGAKGIRTLLFSLLVSLPALINIGLLLFLVMFIYSIFGMNFFMHVKYHAGIDEIFNFQTMGNGMVILFQISTSAGWNSILEGIGNEEDCTTEEIDGVPPNCGNRGMAVAYLLSYLILNFLVIVNMYIAVILENFSQATEDVQKGLTGEDFDLYYETWEKFDPEATHFIHLDQLCDFVDALDEPLRKPIPNFYKVVTLNIPICTEDRVYCKDILDALTKDYLGTGEIELDNIEDVPVIVPDVEGYEQISTTLNRQVEINAAKKIQKFWRKYKYDLGTPAGTPKKGLSDLVVVLIENGTREAASDTTTTPSDNGLDSGVDSLNNLNKGSDFIV
ncbi:unnamed protein product, partial [Owenia fusiformis]